MSMQRVPCNFRNLSLLQKVLIAIFLTTAAICAGVVVIKNCEQNEGNKNDHEIDDEFQNSYIRLGTRLNTQRVTCNFLKNLSILQKVLIAIMLTTAAICVGVLVSEHENNLEPLTDDCSAIKQCQNGGTCVSGIDSHTCACAKGYEGQDCATVTSHCARHEPCLNGGTCVNGTDSHVCICPHEFAGNVCQSENKCRYPGTCAPPRDAGNCHRCRDGFAKDPQDDRRCKYANGNASLLISSALGMRFFSLDGKNTTQMLQNRDNVGGTDYNFRTKTIFWFSRLDKTIYTAPMNTDSAKKSIFHDSLSNIQGLALDWIHNHVYWVDDGKKEICVSNFDGTMKKVFFNKGLQRPISIALNPLNGWMYWTDEGNERIERAGLDGSQREVILSTNIKEPCGLVVDFVDSRLYWSQSQGSEPISIWSSNFDGSDKKLVFIANPSQFSESAIWKIITFDEVVYFTEWFSKTIYIVNKCNGKELTKIYKFESNLHDLKVYEATLQPEGENLCSKRIGRCSHFCFLVPFPASNGTVSTTMCACPDGLSLSSDQQNCVS